MCRREGTINEVAKMYNMASSLSNKAALLRAGVGLGCSGGAMSPCFFDERNTGRRSEVPRVSLLSRKV